jgi:hypothetical protein
MSKPVSFYSEGVKLAGDLFLPADLNRPRSCENARRSYTPQRPYRTRPNSAAPLM